MLDGLCKERDKQPLLEAVLGARASAACGTRQALGRAVCSAEGQLWAGGGEAGGAWPGPGAESADHLSLLGLSFQTPNKVFKRQKLTEALKIIIRII